MTALTVHCPHCQVVNELKILDIMDAEEINCSSCRKSLGTWGDLKDKGAAKRNQDEPQAAPRQRPPSHFVA